MTFAPVKSDPWKKGLPVVMGTGRLWPDSFWKELCLIEVVLEFEAVAFRPSGCAAMRMFQMNRKLKKKEASHDGR